MTTPTGLRWVYPRVCGGTTITLNIRGRSERSIPACAGEPVLSHLRGRVGRVYPRVCGGTTSVGFLLELAAGLSPRVRGNQETRLPDSATDRSIPACAGEPSTRESPPPLPWVYPRVCGGTPVGFHGGVHVHGLSPRVRGNHAPHRRSVLHPGSIPACAGEPSPVGVGGPEAVGLSPRVRGNPLCGFLDYPPERSIPACAGEPSCPRGASHGRGVYPRVCGGTFTAVQSAEALQGLSPRVRGNLLEMEPLFLVGRSIPACAGEPRQASET